jgi:uncharacterized protein YjgD (DUF1641 family)
VTDWKVTDDLVVLRLVRDVKDCMKQAEQELSREDYKKYLDWFVDVLEHEKNITKKTRGESSP